jgi:hypothetical protein
LNLAQVVADEKVATIDQQRTRIRELGPARLRELVLVAFQHAIDKGETDTALAKRFGLKVSTFSRFAGTAEERKVLADLWLNTARVLRHCPEFTEAARASGVWEIVQRVLDRRGRRDKEV